jgi:diacylglycerol O-acyltransferase / wax synthase
MGHPPLPAKVSMRGAFALPGPASPLCLAGARIREMYQIGIVGGNVTVNVGALSYAGQLTIAVAGDPEAVPDLAVVAAGIADTLEHLGADAT